EAPTVDGHALGAAIRLERLAPRLHRQFAALQPRPCAGLTGGDDGAIDGVHRQAVIALVARHRLQRPSPDDAADVEQDAGDPGHEVQRTDARNASAANGSAGTSRSATVTRNARRPCTPWSSSSSSSSIPPVT